MPDSPIQSIDRAAALLELLAAQGTLTVTDAAAALGVHKSTASRLLAALATHGLAEPAGGGRGGYRLGFALVRLAGSVTSRMDLSQAAQMLCDAVARDLGLTANVAIRDETWAVNVSQAVGPSALAPRHYVGLRTPGHATSSGKVLLAWADEAALGQLLSDPLPRFTPATLTDGAELEVELERVRAQGWAASDEEWEEGVTAVAVPLALPGGRIEAALTVTGPAASLPPARFPEVGARLRAIVARSPYWTNA